MAEMKLRTVPDLTEAYEWAFNKQINNELDPKQADGINTTLKGATYLNVKLRMDAAKLLVQAQMKKIIIPKGMLPQLE